MATFTLQVTLGYGCERETEEELTKACSGMHQTSWIPSGFFGSSNSNGQDHKFFVASASHVELLVDDNFNNRSHNNSSKITSSSSTVSVFVPPNMIDALLGKYTAMNKVHASGSCFWIKEKSATQQFARDLLPSIHPSLKDCKIRGIVLTSVAAEENAPAEIVLLDLPKTKNVVDLHHATNGQSLIGNSDAVLKILPISQVKFSPTNTTQPQSSSDTASSPPPLSIPTCAVCLHRIDPVRLGLPTPTNQDLCSKFCPSPIPSLWGNNNVHSEELCPKQRFLERWPPPCRCQACHVIQHYWKTIHHHDDEMTDLFCGECAMHKTLWVCLTCGFVGCGRYSNKHSVKHFQETNHPYSLELATLRVWNYVHGQHGGYAQRMDLLECPSSPPLSHPPRTAGFASAATSSSTLAYSSSAGSSLWSSINSSGGNDISKDFHDHQIIPEKSPKKATMIGEEYEALLYSALEDQAQHYEGEITSLRAELTAILVDQSSMTPEEQREIEELRRDIAKQKEEIAEASRALLDAQSLEAGHRATSQRLLNEQQEAGELLKKIQEEARREHERGVAQMEDLEQQVRDLTANLRMQEQFLQNEELKKAQIVGMSGDTKPINKRGKKKNRFFRK